MVLDARNGGVSRFALQLRWTVPTPQGGVSSGHYPDIRFGVKLYGGNIGFSDGVWTFPLFCAFLLPDVLPELPRR